MFIKTNIAVLLKEIPIEALKCTKTKDKVHNLFIPGFDFNILSFPTIICAVLSQ